MMNSVLKMTDFERRASDPQGKFSCVLSNFLDFTGNRAIRIGQNRSECPENEGVDPAGSDAVPVSHCTVLGSQEHRLAVNCQFGPGSFGDTKILTFCPRYAVVNQLKIPVLFRAQCLDESKRFEVQIRFEIDEFCIKNDDFEIKNDDLNGNIKECTILTADSDGEEVLQIITLVTGRVSAYTLIYSDPILIYSFPTLTYSDPTLIYSDPTLIHSAPILTYSDPILTYSDPTLIYQSLGMCINPNLILRTQSLARVQCDTKPKMSTNRDGLL